MRIEALHRADARAVMAEVAGPAALLVAKAHKIHDRIDSGHDRRLEDKDAADVFRLMQSTSPEDVGRTLAHLRQDRLSSGVSVAATAYLDELFGRRGRPGVAMAARALRSVVPEARVTAICAAYVERMLYAASER
ncbi:MAG TPA: hypothetical protein VHF90_07100 [Thermoleophilaceae bacterium]|nr:hypothetical protein [Thermoleophilaceae bacterium]